METIGDLELIASKCLAGYGQALMRVQLANERGGSSSSSSDPAPAGELGGELRDFQRWVLRREKTQEALNRFSNLLDFVGLRHLRTLSECRRMAEKLSTALVEMTGFMERQGVTDASSVSERCVARVREMAVFCHS